MVRMIKIKKLAVIVPFFAYAYWVLCVSKGLYKRVFMEGPPVFFIQYSQCTALKFERQLIENIF